MTKGKIKKWKKEKKRGYTIRLLKSMTTDLEDLKSMLKIFCRQHIASQGQMTHFLLRKSLGESGYFCTAIKAFKY